MEKANKKISQMFSDGTEMMNWQHKNCCHCVKMSTYNDKNEKYTKFRCSIDRDIQMQSAGFSEFSIRSYSVVQNKVCKYIQTQRKKYKSRKIKCQTELFK